MDLALTLQPGDSFAALPVGVTDPQMVVRVGLLGGASALTILGTPYDLQRLGAALLQAAATGEE